MKTIYSIPHGLYYWKGPDTGQGGRDLLTLSAYTIQSLRKQIVPYIGLLLLLLIMYSRVSEFGYVYSMRPEALVLWDLELQMVVTLVLGSFGKAVSA